MQSKIAIFLCIIFLGTLVNCETGGHHSWRYPNFEEEEEFPNWGGICDEGKRQSPINLTVNHAFKGEFTNFEFHNYDQLVERASILNNGHSVQINIHYPRLEISGAVLNGTYMVEQMHFHWWSEHTIEGRRSPLELHIVHRKDTYNSISDAGAHKDGIAVLGILYHFTNIENDAIGKVVKHIEYMVAKHRVGDHMTMQENFTVSDFLPSNLNTYFTYEGSLTTPPCSEVVTWIVFSETVPITMEQISYFSKIKTKDGQELKYNYRNTQKARNRAVTFVQHSQGNTGYSIRDNHYRIYLFNSLTILVIMRVMMKNNFNLFM